MPIVKNWSKANRSHIKTNVPEKPSVYELKNFGELVYIGESNNLRRRLLCHLDRDPNYYRYKVASGFFTASSKQESKQFDKFVNKYGREPRWNNQDPR